MTGLCNNKKNRVTMYSYLVTRLSRRETCGFPPLFKNRFDFKGDYTLFYKKNNDKKEENCDLLAPGNNS